MSKKIIYENNHFVGDVFMLDEIFIKANDSATAK